MSVTASQIKELRERTGAGMLECRKALLTTAGDIEQAIELMRKEGKAKALKKSGRIAGEGLIAIAVSNDNKRAIMLEVNCETDFVARDEGFRHFVNTLAQRGLQEAVHDVNALSALPYQASGKQTIEEFRQELISKIGENIQIRRLTLMSSAGMVGHYQHGDKIGVLVDLSVAKPELGKDLAMHITASQPVVVAPEDVPAELLRKEEEIFTAQAQDSGKPAEVIAKMVQGRLSKYINEVSLMGQPYVKDSSMTISALLKVNNAKVKHFIRYEVGEGIEKKVENFAEEVMAQVGQTE